MLKNRGLWLCCIIVFSLASLYADTVPGDPTMVVNDPTCDGCQVVNALTPFTFSSNAAGGGTTVFQVNPNGPGFFSLDIETPGTFSSTDLVNCSSNEFNCTVSFLGDVTDIFFSQRTCDLALECSPGGFPAGDVFSVDLDNPGTVDVGGWGPNREFTAIANLTSAPTDPRISAPEPSSLFLLGTGAALLAGRKRMKGRKV